MIVVCLGSGPSLCADDVDRCYGPATVIAINDAYQLAPWADILYAPDAQWWKRTIAVPHLPLLRYTLQPDAQRYRDRVTVLPFTGQDGIDWTPMRVRTGRHGGYSAINIACHLQPSRIVLLGYDLQPSPTYQHHFADLHAVTIGRTLTRYAAWLPRYNGLAAELASHGIEIVNASRQTAIPDDMIHRMDLGEALRP